MQGLKIYTKSGEAPTSEEIEFAHRVANQHKEMKFGVITMTDPTSGVIAEYHAYNNTVFTSGDVGAYFGYDASVDMRCWCRGVVLAETAAPAQSVTIARENVVITGYFMGVWNGTFDLVARVNGVEVGRVSGYINQTAGSIGSGQIAPVLEYINGSSGDVGAPTQYAVLTQTASYTWTDYGWVVVSDNKSWSTPFDSAIESALASAAATAHQRSAVFITDGTELGSAARTDSPDGRTLYNVLGTTIWDGGTSVKLFNKQYAVTTGGQAESQTIYYPAGVLNITIPEDACYIRVIPSSYPAAMGTSVGFNIEPSLFITTNVIDGVNQQTVFIQPYDQASYELHGSFNINTSTYTNWFVDADDPDTANPSYVDTFIPYLDTCRWQLFNGYWDVATLQFIGSFTPCAPSFEDVISNTLIHFGRDFEIQDALHWYIDWRSNQKIALTREHNRRKKCSDGQLAYIRNGFLSPEFEYFIKTRHPVSVLVRRDIPMLYSGYESSAPVINLNPSYDINAIGAQLYKTTSSEIKVTLSYVEKDANGNDIERHQAFNWSTTTDEYRTSYNNGQGYLTWTRDIATNLPMLNPINGSAGLLDFEASGHIVGDKSNNTDLFMIRNGIAIGNSAWVQNSHGGTPVFNPIHSMDGEFPPDSYGIYSYTHPQFLLDYIAASKPIEKEVIDGNKVPVTPSTDWLSSRLAHNEVVTIIPLSFVNANGEDRGMYPYSRADEIPTQVKLVGFAKVKYNYYTGSFTFESWTEFTTEGNIKHDGNASYDAETNPTSVNIGGTVYTLQPKYFAYNSAWTTPNCVCIAGKTQWTDTKAAYKTQKTNIADIPPDGYILTNEELLYNEVRKSIK